MKTKTIKLLIEIVLFSVATIIPWKLGIMFMHLNGVSDSNPDISFLNIVMVFIGIFTCILGIVIPCFWAYLRAETLDKAGNRIATFWKDVCDRFMNFWNWLQER